MRILSGLAALAALSAAGAAFAQTSIDLGRYAILRTFDLPLVAASESSAITWNWDNGNLFVLGDEGDALVEVTRAGATVSTMTLTGFDDTEGLAYIGGGRFVLTEERLQTAYRLTYTPGGTIDRAALPSVNFGPTVGNVGNEGISFDPRSGRFVGVKEKTPQSVLDLGLDFAAGVASITALGVPTPALLDLSDVAVLAGVPALAGRPAADNLLIVSQESARLVEVTRAGAILSRFDFAGTSISMEGVTIDADGVIYLTDESPRVYVLTPVPEPSTWVALTFGLALLGWRMRRRA